MAGWGREIVTLQCGHYSNFVGTHIWNIQESTFQYDENPAAVASKEINHDVLYREGRTLTGAITYTPRLVTLDLKGSLNTLKAEGVLYECHSKEDIKWEGDVNLHEEKPQPKNEFLSDLDAQDEEMLYIGQERTMQALRSHPKLVLTGLPRKKVCGCWNFSF